MTKSFITELINDRRQALDVYELDGSVLVRLEPRQSFTIESVSAETLYAKWSSVKWREDGTIGFVSRTDWSRPQMGRWVIELLNQDGADPVEYRMVGDQRVAMPKGITVEVSCPLTDPLIMFRSLTIARRRVMTKSDEADGLLVHRWITADERTPRPDSELKALQRILDDLAERDK